MALGESVLPVGLGKKEPGHTVGLHGSQPRAKAGLGTSVCLAKTRRPGAPQGLEIHR